MERRSREEIVEEILKAAIKCKYEAGINDVQVTQIAAKASISTRTLNRYFPDKEEMIATASLKYLRDQYEEIVEEYSKLEDLDQMNGLERLIRFLGMRINHYLSDMNYAVVFVDANINCIRSGVRKDTFNVYLGAETRKLVLEDLSLGIKDGSIRADIDVEVVSALLSSSFNGLMQRMIFVLRTSQMEEKKKQTKQIFVEYVAMVKKFLQP